MIDSLRYEFQIEALNGRVQRIEKTTPTSSTGFAEFYLPSITREQQLRIKIYDQDDPGNPVGIILLKR